MKEKKTLTIEQIKPYVRYAKILHMSGKFANRGVVGCDNRLLYFFSGMARLTVTNRADPEDTREIIARPDTLYIWTPNYAYSLEAITERGFTVFVANFDYTYGDKGASICLPAPKKEDFSEDMRFENVEFSDFPQLAEFIGIDEASFAKSDCIDLDTEFINPKRNYLLMLSSLMQTLLIRTVRATVADNYGTGIPRPLAEVLDYIHAHFNEPCSNKELGLMFNYHPNYLSRLVFSYTGMTLHQYKSSLQMMKAIELLKSTEMSVSEIAEAVGFKTTKHFSQAFKNAMGFSPKHFRA